MGNLTVKESGEMVNFISPNVSKITSFKVHFSPKQEGSGDPSPENVREITGWNGVTATRSGKNLIDKTAYENIYTTYDYIDSSYRCKKIQLKPNTTYTVSFTSTGADANVIILFNYTSHVNGNTFLDLRKASGSKTYTTDNTGCLYIGSVNTNNDKYNARMSVCEIQIEEGSTATDYEPYTGQTYPITFPTEVGTIYGGYVDLVSGELVQEYFKYSFSGDEDISITSYVKTPFLFNTTTNDLTMPFGNNPNVKPYCNILNTETSKYHYISDNTAVINSISRYSQVLFRGDIFGDTAETAKAKLKELYENGTPLTIVGTIRDTVIDNFKYQLTPQQLSTLKGQNNFWSNADYIEIEYELTETFDIQKAKRKIILNQPHVESASGDIVTFDTDMKGKLKECKVYFNPVQEGEGDPSPDNVRNIVGWNGVSVGLPSEYQEVEYIESTGTQWINTGVIGKPNIEVNAKFELTDNTDTNNCGLIGSRESSSATRFYIISFYSHRWHLGIPNDKTTTSYPINKNQIQDVIFKYINGNYSLIVDNTEVFTGQSTITTTYPMYLFGVNNYGTVSRQGSFKLYSLIIQQDGTLVRNFIPCYRKSDNEIGIYDTVSKQFFTNQGTGIFLKGNNVNSIQASIDWTNDVGTVYGGYVDLASGELVVNRCFLENNDWKEYKRNNGFVAYKLDTMPMPKDKNQICKPISNIISIFTNFLSDNMTKNVMQITGTTLYVALAEGIDASEIQLSYELADPIHYQLTPQQILTFKGTNNVYSDANGQTEIKYWKH